MKEIKVLIADDESGIRSILRKMVEKVEGFALSGEADNGPDLIALVEKTDPHVVFLDVEMPGLTGVECARIIQDMNPATMIIFATAHDCYMGDAFEVYAFDYLVKPFKVERVVKTLERARDRIVKRAETPLPPLQRANKVTGGRIMLSHKEGVTFINMQDIVLIQREQRSTVIYTVSDERFVTGDSLLETEARLDKDVFFRCHKSYIINLGHIRDITPYGRWTYVIRLNGTKHDALITHEKYEELRSMFA